MSVSPPCDAWHIQKNNTYTKNFEKNGNSVKRWEREKGRVCCGKLIDRGAWTVTAPLAERPVPASGMTDMPEFSTPDPLVAAQGMVFSRGPASGGVEGPVHFRLGVANGQVRSVETLTGFAHRGMEARMAGVSLADAAGLSGRIHVGATLAHQWAFSAAVEQAVGMTVVPMIDRV